MKKLTLFLILAIFLSTVGCNGSSGESTVTDTDPVSDPVEVEVNETDRSQINDNIGVYDFDKKTYTIVYSAEQFAHTVYPYSADEINGEILNDTIYKSRITVNERFNTGIEYVSTGGKNSEVANAIKTSVLAGDDAYQLAISHMYAGFNGLLEMGAVQDFSKLDNEGYIDLSRPWWNQSLTENILINGVLPTAISDFVYSYVDVIYFNKKLLGDYQLDDPYKLVLDGSWTWDKLISQAKLASKDIDGDNTFTEKDQYGYTCQSGSLTTRFIHSNGMKIGNIEKDGTISLTNIVSDKMQEIIEKVYSIYWNDNLTYMATSEDTRMNLFKSGQALFTHSVTANLNELRDTEFEFGIVPLPKYDEKQEKYQSMASTQMLLVPATADPEFAGVILEALSAEAYRYTVPALYETLYSNKYLRDEQSYQMYLIIRDSLVYDPIWVYGDGCEFAYLVNNTAVKKSIDLSSFYAQHEAKVKQVLTDVHDSIISNYAG